MDIEMCKKLPIASDGICGQRLPKLPKNRVTVFFVFLWD